MIHSGVAANGLKRQQSMKPLNGSWKSLTDNPMWMYALWLAAIVVRFGELNTEDLLYAISVHEEAVRRRENEQK